MTSPGTSIAEVRPPVRTREPRVEQTFDLRPQRDVVSRRVWRERVRRAARIATLLGGEAIAAAVALAVALLATGGVAGVASGWPHLLPMVFLLGVAGQAAVRTYGPARERRGYLRSALGAVGTVAVLWLLGRIYPTFRLPADAYALLGLALGSGYAAVRVGVEFLIRHIYSRELGRRPTVILGEHEAAWEIYTHLLASDDRQARVVGHLVPDPQKDPTALGGLEDLQDVIETYDIRSVIVSAQLPAGRFQEVVRQCLLHGASVSVVPAELSTIPCRFSSQQLAGWPLIELQIPRLHLAQVVLKRTVDIVVSLTAIVLLAPLGLLIAACVWRESPGPPLFRQRRLGLGGRPFWIYKFRSMRADAEEVLKSDPFLYRRYVENDYKLPPREDPRITRLGRFLRRTSLDELPQLFNVLKGDMSLVGPRPVVPDEIEHYGRDARIFLAVKPGLTGQWQTNGRSEVPYPERAQLDIDYITNWTLGTDLKILWQTVPAVLKRNGAY